MNKSIIIVTGASRGIGKAIALEVADDSTLVVCIAKKNQAQLMDTIERIQNNGFDAYPVLCDVSDYEQVKLLFDEIALLNLPVKTIINNAGIGLRKLFIDMSIHEWNQVINTNLTSVFNMCHFGIKAMLTEGSGQIINISSIWGNDGASMETAYSASKGGINSLTKALAKEYGPSHIHVNAVACGVINTSMNDYLNHEEEAALKDDISLGRFGTASEVAVFISTLIHSAPYLNGQVITYDGGRY